MPNSYFQKLIKTIFIAVNILIAIIFFIGCYAKWFSSANSWLIGLFTLASFFLFIILLIFFIGWLLVRSAWSILFIITILLTWKPFTNIIPFRFTSSFNLQKQTNALRVMSWNVESFEILKVKTHPEEKEKMIRLINQYQPDIACFQEMSSADSSKTADYRLQDFIDSLHFPYHYYVYDVAEDYYPRTHTHYGKIIFSRLPIINKQTIKNPPGDYNYTFEYCDIKNGNDTIRVFNVHLQTMKFTDENYNYIDSFSLRTKRDLKESKGIIEKLKASFSKRHAQADFVKSEMNKSPYPIIICGDFNDVPNSYAYETIGDGLQNAFVKKGVGFGRSFSEILPTLRIDNIFVDPKFSVLQYTRIKKRLSDHYPVITDLLFSAQ
jgi:endonuclease/exonuclease/phosphatase family metal-dependent hydrolase